MEEKKRFYTFSIRENWSTTGEGAKLEIVVDTKKGITKARLTMSYEKSVEVTKIDELEKLFEKLTGGNGRKIIEVDDLVKLL